MRLPRFCRYAVLTLASAALLACQRGQQDSERNPAASSEVVSAATTEALAREFGPMLRGVWVKEDYLAEVVRTRSPFRAAPTLEGVAALRIDPDRRTADSMRVGVNLNNHEGDELTLYFRPGSSPKALPTNRRNYEQPGDYFELAYEQTPADTILLLRQYQPNGRMRQSTRYRRLERQAKAAGAEADAVQRFVNRQLLAGTYAATDSAGRRSQVRFTPEGTVRGLGRFRTYRAATDFVVTADNNLDYLILDPESPRRRIVSYASTPDTLRLYAVRSESPDLLRGRLQYTLVRQRLTADRSRR